MPTTAPPRFAPLTGLYEPSAIRQLPDGRFLVVEDEKAHPFSLVRFAPDGAVDSRPLTPGWFEGNDAFWKLDDLEGLALDATGQLYAITSHSRDGGGEEKKSRNKLVRFRVEGERVLDPKVVVGLKAALTAAHPVLARAAAVAEVKDGGGFNIEALETSADGEQLLIGFRGPLDRGRALIARVLNLRACFDDGEAPRVSPALEAIDLGGHGLRAICRLPDREVYLLVGGPQARQDEPFGLWCWPGAGEAARPISVPGLDGFARAEGVCVATIDGVRQLIVVSDDGSRADRRPAHYLRLDLDRLDLKP